MRIAMWSGPRNLSTAMMYSFSQRSDCQVIDEPFYAAYLAKTGLTHPMTAEILASQPNEYADVMAQLASENSHPIQYEKHMTHHMLQDTDLSWLSDVINVFLIRHPARVIASYAAKRENPTLDDIGFRQQFDLFQHIQSLGQTPIVIDSFDVRCDPSHALSNLCQAIGIPYEPAMLTWPKGENKADGVWASHWYGAVHNSTGFAAAEGAIPQLDPELAKIENAAMRYYEPLAALKI